jgi:hypothetical protein
MKKMLVFTVVALLISMGGFIQAAEASALSMSYDIIDSGSGLYTYDFTLKLDNHDTSWTPGESFDWLVFGDAVSTYDSFGNLINQGVSPLGPDGAPLGFVGDNTKLPVGSWTNYNYSSGGHNGPTLVNFLGGWKPLAINETLTWSGTSSHFVGQGDMLFSTLINYDVNGFVAWPTEVNGFPVDLNTYAGHNANLELATLNQVVVTPEPASMILFGLGGAAMAAFRRRKQA